MDGTRRGLYENPVWTGQGGDIFFSFPALLARVTKVGNALLWRMDTIRNGNASRMRDNPKAGADMRERPFLPVSMRPRCSCSSPPLGFVMLLAYSQLRTKINTRHISLDLMLWLYFSLA